MLTYKKQIVLHGDSSGKLSFELHAFMQEPEYAMLGEFLTLELPEHGSTLLSSIQAVTDGRKRTQKYTGTMFRVSAGTKTAKVENITDGRVCRVPTEELLGLMEHWMKELRQMCGDGFIKTQIRYVKQETEALRHASQ